MFADNSGKRLSPSDRRTSLPRGLSSFPWHLTSLFHASPMALVKKNKVSEQRENTENRHRCSGEKKKSNVRSAATTMCKLISQ